MRQKITQVYLIMTFLKIKESTVRFHGVALAPNFLVACRVQDAKRKEVHLLRNTVRYIHRMGKVRSEEGMLYYNVITEQKKMGLDGIVMEVIKMMRRTIYKISEVLVNDCLRGSGMEVEEMRESTYDCEWKILLGFLDFYKVVYLFVEG